MSQITKQSSSDPLIFENMCEDEEISYLTECIRLNRNRFRAALGLRQTIHPISKGTYGKRVIASQTPEHESTD